MKTIARTYELRETHAKRMEPQVNEHINEEVNRVRPQGGTLIFSAYIGSDPASIVHPQKYQKFEAPPKNI